MTNVLYKKDWPFVTAQISPVMNRKLLAHCGKCDITRSQLIRRLLHEEFEKHKQGEQT